MFRKNVFEIIAFVCCTVFCVFEMYFLLYFMFVLCKAQKCIDEIWTSTNCDFWQNKLTFLGCFISLCNLVLCPILFIDYFSRSLKLFYIKLIVLGVNPIITCTNWLFLQCQPVNTLLMGLLRTTSKNPMHRHRQQSQMIWSRKLKLMEDQSSAFAIRDLL